MKTVPEIPPEFLSRMSSLLGGEFPGFDRALRESPRAALRANTLKVSPRALVELLGLQLDPVPWSPEGFLVPPGIKMGAHAYHTAGLFYLQDPTAMAVAVILDPQPGERVLDLAAAPGGKATHICARMENRGLLVANEIQSQRASALAGNLERWGACNAIITNETPERLADHFGPYFDRVLVDAPCSGEGLFRKNPSARLEWSEAGVQQCALRQGRLLDQAVRLVRPGGSLVYSTCTFAPEENEGAVARLLEEHPEFNLEEPPQLPGFSRGREDWLPPGRSNPLIRQTIRIWPQHAPGEGHFIALLRRDRGPLDSRLKPARRPDPGLAQREFGRFQSEYLMGGIDPAFAYQRGSNLYLPPEWDPDLDGLRVVHPGWHVGWMPGERFEPSHWLATALRMEDARLQVNFDPEDPGLITFLRGGSQGNSGEAGWVLVGVGGYPVGWGKRTAGQLKSKVPRGLRLR